MIKMVLALGLAASMMLPSSMVLANDDFGRPGDKITFGSSRNPYMQDLLTLQEQVQILARLEDRQKTILDMAQNYQDVGVEFEYPAPSRDVCRKIPANAACAREYTDMYEDYTLPWERGGVLSPAIDPADVLAMTPDMMQIDLEPPAPKLSWVSVNCLTGACRAVIVENTESSQRRYTVREGDELISGGKVTSVTRAGVKVMIDGKPETLKPFKGDGLSES